jgi:glycine dehydrogenase subunit 1
MGNYLGSTSSQQQQMLKELGLTSLDELFENIPHKVKLNLPLGKSELEVARQMTSIAAKNKIYSSIFRGAGSYNHYIPSIVRALASKEEFLTAYTPYQPEINQGLLQIIFEYQTMICQLTDMDVANASVYDGSSAAAEATVMCKERNRQTVLISASSNPDVIETIATYCEGSNTPYKIVPIKEGVTDLEKLDSLLNEESSCFYVQQPNYLGLLEDCTTISELVHTKGAKFIMGVNPIACSIIKSPGECGADIAVGEGQPLGLPLAFGGPYLGFMATKSSMTRRLPGRIVGQTVDSEGNRGFVLTLQAREQHIRREKATSNICSNQAHCALTAAIYLSAMGSSGLKQVASLSTSKAHYLANQLSQVGFNLVYQKEFFNEFVTKCDSDLKHKIIQKLEEHSILGPLPIEEGLLWCCTEVNSKEEIDKVVELVAKVVLK